MSTIPGRPEHPPMCLRSVLMAESLSPVALARSSSLRASATLWVSTLGRYVWDIGMDGAADY